MNIYTVMSKMYDLLEITYFSNKERNPRSAINHLIPENRVKVLDMCCGTLANSIPIAKNKENVKVLGIDVSKQMLQVARKKMKKEALENIQVKCMDATNTNMKSGSFDFIVIGLALHEMNPLLRKNILFEAYRLLKEDGKLIILEWEKPQRFIQKVLFFPLFVLEQICCKSFLKFYKCEKRVFFEKYGFHAYNVIHSSYSVVMELGKQKRN